MKYCTNCGKQIEKDTKFCPYCGAKQQAIITDSESNKTADQPSALTKVQMNYSKNSQGSTLNTKFNTQPTGNATDSSSLQQQDNENQYNYSHNLTPTERNYVDTYVANHSKHMLPAYLLLLLFICATHFYLHQNAAGIVILLINLILDWFIIGLVIDVIWFLVDIVCIPFWVHGQRTRAKRQAISYVMMNRQR